MYEPGHKCITLPAVDGYPLTVRYWEAREATAVIVIVHGVVSHSLWLAPIAEKLAGSGITVVCPDRRGAGANRQARGDAPDETSLLGDLHKVISNFEAAGIPMHLAGFCWGSNYLINFLCRHQVGISSLALLAPAIFPAAELRNADLYIDDSAEPTEIPPVPLDAFTRGPAYEGFILPDSLRLQRVSPRFNRIMQSYSRMIGVKLLKLPYPVLMILAEDDRITDNQTTEKLFDRLKAQPKQLVYVPGRHGIQFDAPIETANALAAWLNRLNQQPLQGLSADCR
ncbi:MAG TPA: alpha/beta fold hydrolase [Gammaproteobacteria bacterium]